MIKQQKWNRELEDHRWNNLLLDKCPMGRKCSRKLENERLK